MNIVIAIQAKWCTRQTKWCALLQKGLYSENTGVSHSCLLFNWQWLYSLFFTSAPATLGQVPPEGHPFNPTLVSTSSKRHRIERGMLCRGKQDIPSSLALVPMVICGGTNIVFYCVTHIWLWWTQRSEYTVSQIVMIFFVCCTAISIVVVVYCH